MTDISYYLSLPYTKVLRRDDEGDIVATIAELDGCMAHGSDESEALQNLRDAQTAWLEAAITAEQDIPVPEIEEDLPSGKFVVRVPRSLHQRLNKLAKKDDVSLNQLMVVAATEHVARREARDEMRASVVDSSAWQRADFNWGRPARHTTARRVSDVYLQTLRKRRVMPGAENRRHTSRWPRERRG